MITSSLSTAYWHLIRTAASLKNFCLCKIDILIDSFDSSSLDFISGRWMLLRFCTTPLRVVLVRYGRSSLTRTQLWRFSAVLNRHIETISAQMRLRSTRFYTTESSNVEKAEFSQVSEAEFESSAEDFLHCLTEWFERLEDLHENIPDEFDVNYSQGVLTVCTGPTGTFVINKQSPNRQIWLSSPTSGPKRFDLQGDEWIYRHTQETLAELISAELAVIFLDPKLKFEWKKKC